MTAPTHAKRRKGGWRRYRKFYVAAATAASTAVAQGLITGTAAKDVAVALACLGAWGVCAVKNDPS